MSSTKHALEETLLELTRQLSFRLNLPQTPTDTTPLLSLDAYQFREDDKSREILKIVNEKTGIQISYEENIPRMSLDIKTDQLTPSLKSLEESCKSIFSSFPPLPSQSEHPQRQSSTLPTRSERVKESDIDNLQINQILTDASYRSLNQWTTDFNELKRCLVPIPPPGAQINSAISLLIELQRSKGEVLVDTWMGSYIPLARSLAERQGSWDVGVSQRSLEVLTETEVKRSQDWTVHIESTRRLKDRCERNNMDYERLRRVSSSSVGQLAGSLSEQDEEKALESLKKFLADEKGLLSVEEVTMTTKLEDLTKDENPEFGEQVEGNQSKVPLTERGFDIYQTRGKYQFILDVSNLDQSEKQLVLGLSKSTGIHLSSNLLISQNRVYNILINLDKDQFLPSLAQIQTAWKASLLDLAMHSATERVEKEDINLYVKMSEKTISIIEEKAFECCSYLYQLYSSQLQPTVGHNVKSVEDNTFKGIIGIGKEGKNSTEKDIKNLTSLKMEKKNDSDPSKSILTQMVALKLVDMFVNLRETSQKMRMDLSETLRTLGRPVSTIISDITETQTRLDGVNTQKNNKVASVKKTCEEYQLDFKTLKSMSLKELRQLITQFSTTTHQTDQDSLTILRNYLKPQITLPVSTNTLTPVTDPSLDSKGGISSALGGEGVEEGGNKKRRKRPKKLKLPSWLKQESSSRPLLDKVSGIITSIEFVSDHPGLGRLRRSRSFDSFDVADKENRDVYEMALKSIFEVNGEGGLEGEADINEGKGTENIDYVHETREGGIDEGDEKSHQQDEITTRLDKLVQIQETTRSNTRLADKKSQSEWLDNVLESKIPLTELMKTLDGWNSVARGQAVSQFETIREGRID
ncbi:hypothetical protein TREMEDRAFT_64210 [Tremella mesenterica DSM 1558]|uniref:uncharacterized protein n=1 Tax=Tremella mesenterica (strain ATCC 24925 / CBS 8224 / DSM 1558 / NBRC 9311 / NRRL Y-6157 / RJB 2259-6 / UBC 559-6) TaxID=578456 RepID=UPI0003F498BB|nr:uncharacterized protein TREMEDRAFT_64210 [Tremella mesenterica DSM 1558]EIW67619.1 hypothetical protein TREMEDRAFT_64210 [Tremella mesenterica DSM 1558]